MSNTSIKLLQERNRRMHSEKSIKNGLDFQPKPSDVFVVTYPKCGTTLTTAIVHALRAPDIWDFEEITVVAPWDIIALDCGQDLNAPQCAEPRLYKSHETWSTIAKGARYIYVIRHPADAFISFYNFLPAYMHLSPESITFEEFAQAIFAGLSHSGGIWSHFVDWIKAAQQFPDQILIVAFEDLKKDLTQEIARISHFLFPHDTTKDIRRAVELTTFEAMSARSTQFDDHFVFDCLKAQIGIDDGIKHQATKVHRGSVGARAQLPATVLSMLHSRWTNTVQPALGCSDYSELLNLVHKLQNQHHPSPVFSSFSPSS